MSGFSVGQGMGHRAGFKLQATLPVMLSYASMTLLHGAQDRESEDRSIRMRHRWLPTVRRKHGD